MQIRTVLSCISAACPWPTSSMGLLIAILRAWPRSSFLMMPNALEWLLLFLRPLNLFLRLCYCFRCGQVLSRRVTQLHSLVPRRRLPHRCLLTCIRTIFSLSLLSPQWLTVWLVWRECEWVFVLLILLFSTVFQRKAWFNWANWSLIRTLVQTVRSYWRYWIS
jgi:hypothetical protein